MKKRIPILFKKLIVASSLIGILLQCGLPYSFSLSSLRYFTTLSNIFVVIYFATHLKKQNPTLKFAVTMSISLTGLVAHFMLGDLFTSLPQNQQLGLFFLHYMTPICVVLDWILFSKKGKTKKEMPLYATIFPIVYLIFAFSTASKFGYPYPFMDVNQLGTKAVAINLFVLTCAYLAIGYLAYLLDQKIKR